jgi:hypothetical protein
MLSITERAVVDSDAAVDTPPAPVPLPRYDEACRAVAEARTVDEVQQIAANAEAVRAYARQAKNRQLELDAAEIRIRAERRLGELMAAQRATIGLAKGAAEAGTNRGTTRDEQHPASLAEAGIDKNLAKRARALAAVVDEKFEELLDDKRRSQDRRVVLGPNAPRALATALKAENEALSQEVAALNQLVAALKAENEASTQQVAALKAENEALRAAHKQERRTLEGLVMKWKERAMIAED